MTIQNAPRTVTLTIWKLEADRIETTGFSDVHARHAIGRIWAYASGDGVDHRTEVRLADRVCIGDTYTVVVDPPRQAGT